MADVTIHTKLENLAAAMVLIQRTDVESLAEIHSHFEDLIALISKEDAGRVLEVVQRAKQLVERIILDEEADPDASLEILGRTVGSLQEIYRDGKSPDHVNFPRELDLTGKEADHQEKADRAPSPDSGNTKEMPIGPPLEVDEKVFADFVTRQHGALEEWEALVLKLEDSGNQAVFDELRRLVHSLKGESALLGLEDVERLCHCIEDALQQEPSDQIGDALLAAKDWLEGSLAYYSGKGTLPPPVDEIVKAVDQTRSRELEASSEDSDCLNEAAGGDEASSAMELDPLLLGDFVAEALEHLETTDVNLLTLETDPENQEAIAAVFRAFHTIKGMAGFLSLDDIGALAHEAENLLDRVRKGDLLITGSAIDVSFDSIDSLKRLVAKVQHCLRTGESLARDAMVPPLINKIREIASGHAAESRTQESPPRSEEKIGEILVASGAASNQSVAAALEAQKENPDGGKLGEILVKNGDADAKTVAQALRSQRPVSEQCLVAVRETVKVDASRLDRLVDTIGELVIAESMIGQAPEIMGVNNVSLARKLGQLDKITRELQEMAMSLRMVPVRPIFQKMARLVRDLSKKTGKPIEFVMVGEDSELDKSVVDRIGDPLVHMVRNAVDHGIESDPKKRLRAGKPETARVELRAFHGGGNIFIEIEDDGRGIDRDAVLSKAVERGLVAEGDSLSDREVFALLLEPGFSTAKKVTDVSGRGVGLDVVKRNIEALRGHIEIRSEAGRGTLFSIRLPLTLAIIDGMIVRTGGERYIVPALSVLRTIRPESEEISTVLQKGEMLVLKDELIPLFRLESLFSVKDAQKDPTRALVVIVEENGRRAGLVVDELLEKQQIVIKSLGDAMCKIQGISGGAILPDGQVGLILDVEGLMRLAHSDHEIGCMGSEEMSMAPVASDAPIVASPDL